MTIIPAIDIINGACVRLEKGDYQKQTTYHSDPVTMAKTFEDAGLSKLHLVDLDGAKAGKVINLKVLENIAKQTLLHIDFGGGIKTDDDITRVFDVGAAQVTLGSIAVKSPETVEKWIGEYGAERIIIGADVQGEEVMIAGWLKGSNMGVRDLINQYLALGVQDIMCTDISKDGMLQGPSIELYQNLIAAFPSVKLIASGGVSNIDDLHELKHIGCHAAIVGKAIYEGKITLAQLAEFTHAH